MERPSWWYEPDDDGDGNVEDEDDEDGYFDDGVDIDAACGYDDRPIEIDCYYYT